MRSTSEARVNRCLLCSHIHMSSVGPSCAASGQKVLANGRPADKLWLHLAWCRWDFLLAQFTRLWCALYMMGDLAASSVPRFHQSAPSESVAPSHTRPLQIRTTHAGMSASPVNILFEFSLTRQPPLPVVVPTSDDRVPACACIGRSCVWLRPCLRNMQQFPEDFFGILLTSSVALQAFPSLANNYRAVQAFCF